MQKKLIAAPKDFTSYVTLSFPKEGKEIYELMCVIGHDIDVIETEAEKRSKVLQLLKKAIESSCRALGLMLLGLLDEDQSNKKAIRGYIRNNLHSINAPDCFLLELALWTRSSITIKKVLNSVTDPLNFPPLLRILSKGDKDSYKLLAKAGAPCVALAKKLISSNTNPNLAGNLLELALLTKKQKLITAILERGADRQDSYGYSPLTDAIIQGDLKRFTRLLKAGASPNTENGNGKSALMYAVELSHGASYDYVSELINARADITHVDDNGNSVLDSYPAEPDKQLERFILRTFRQERAKNIRDLKNTELTAEQNKIKKAIKDIESLIKRKRKQSKECIPKMRIFRDSVLLGASLGFLAGLGLAVGSMGLIGLVCIPIGLIGGGLIGGLVLAPSALLAALALNRFKYRL